jgi:hypothetical protein
MKIHLAMGGIEHMRKRKVLADGTVLLLNANKYMPSITIIVPSGAEAAIPDLYTAGYLGYPVPTAAMTLGLDRIANVRRASASVSPPPAEVRAFTSVDADDDHVYLAGDTFLVQYDRVLKQPKFSEASESYGNSNTGVRIDGDVIYMPIWTYASGTGFSHIRVFDKATLEFDSQIDIAVNRDSFNNYATVNRMAIDDAYLYTIARSPAGDVSWPISVEKGTGSVTLGPIHGQGRMECIAEWGNLLFIGGRFFETAPTDPNVSVFYGEEASVIAVDKASLTYQYSNDTALTVYGTGMGVVVSQEGEDTFVYALHATEGAGDQVRVLVKYATDLTVVDAIQLPYGRMNHIAQDSGRIYLSGRTVNTATVSDPSQVGGLIWAVDKATLDGSSPVGLRVFQQAPISNILSAVVVE